jgi:xylulokinase
MNAGSRAGLLLGLDIGTSRIKAVAIDAAGAEQASASVATPFVASAAGIDMEVADLGRALADAIAALGRAPEQLGAVGIAGLAESGAPLRAGRPLAPIIAWHDGRGEETVASLEHRFGPDLARWTGRRVRTVSSLAKLGWLLDHGLPEPDRWLGVPELALFLLTGAEATEHSLAARTGAYHVIERRFLPEVIEHVLRPGGQDPAGARPGRAVAGTLVHEPATPAGLCTSDAPDGRSPPGDRADAASGRLFPPVLAAGEVMGRVSEDGAAAYGLPVGIPVTIAGHDHLAAAAGLGGGPDDLFNSVGTAETLIRRLETAPDVDRALELDLAVTVWPGGVAWGVLASATRSGLVIDALADHLGSEPADLDRLVAADPPADAVIDGPMVDLGQGIEVPDGPPAVMWTATLEVLARRTAAAAERVSALAGPHRRLVVFGGGSRSPVWLRAKIAEMACPVVTGADAGAARGAALTAGVAAAW